VAYDGKVLRRAEQQFEDDRDARERAFSARREEILRKNPRLREVETELRGTMSRIISGALRKDTDPRTAVERLREENIRLQRERTELLADMGLPADALEEKVSCALCGDTGWTFGRMCRCLRQYYAREQQKELSKLLDLGSQSFDTFSLEWYSDRYDGNYGLSARENMENVYNACAEFANGFGRRKGSLLLYGAPGLGKTFLSAAIAREVSAAGWSVVYDTAERVFSAMEERKFGRDEDDAEVDRLFACDLLILDDLGTEMTTAFVQSALYRIVNTRLIEGRSTILNTNLTPEEISRRYSPQVASRLEGEYQILPFFGQDIRRQKKGR